MANKLLAVSRAVFNRKGVHIPFPAWCSKFICTADRKQPFVFRYSQQLQKVTNRLVHIHIIGRGFGITVVAV